MKYFKQAILHKTDDRGESVYMCGEINRLLGNSDSALEYLQQVAQYANTDDKQKGLLDLSQEQIQATKTGRADVMVRSKS